MQTIRQADGWPDMQTAGQNGQIKSDKKKWQKMTRDRQKEMAEDD